MGEAGYIVGVAMGEGGVYDGARRGMEGEDIEVGGMVLR